jgi:hypothetical protein
MYIDGGTNKLFKIKNQKSFSTFAKSKYFYNYTKILLHWPKQTIFKIILLLYITQRTQMLINGILNCFYLQDEKIDVAYSKFLLLVAID